MHLCVCALVRFGALVRWCVGVVLVLVLDVVVMDVCIITYRWLSWR